MPEIFMKRAIILLALVVGCFSSAPAAPVSTNTTAFGRVLLIDSSSMPVGGGKATLIIGPLQRTNGVFTGDYKLNIFPYFLRTEKGRLAIVVSDESLAEAGQGKVVAVTGTATTNGKNGRCRPIAAIATPVDRDHGMLKLWFTAGSRKMIFEPAYHFAGKETALVLAETTEIKP